MSLSRLVWNMGRAAKFCVCMLFSLVLTACFGAGDELQEWMKSQRANVPIKVVPIAAPKQFKPQDYNQTSEMEPFNNQKLLQALRKETPQTSANLVLITPELNRRKDALENFPLDAMAMVGSLNKDKELVGLLRVDKLLYQVKVGNYIGSNYGRITKITDSEIVLREIAQDAGGEWVERKVNLQLQVKEK